MRGGIAVEFPLIVYIEEEEAFSGAAEFDGKKVGVFAEILPNLVLEVGGLPDVNGNPRSDERVGGEDEFVHVVRDGVELPSCFLFPGARFLDGENVCLASGSDFKYSLLDLLSFRGVMLDDGDFSPLLAGGSVQDEV